MKVDKSVYLADILGVPEEWQTCHRIRALVIDGKCPAQAGLLELKREQVEDYKKIKKVLWLIGTCDRVRNENHVKRSGQYREIYEMRGGNARLFFFYTSDEQIVVCLNVYRKRKSSRVAQNEAFALAERLRQRYMSCGRKDA